MNHCRGGRGCTAGKVCTARMERIFQSNLPSSSLVLPVTTTTYKQREENELAHENVS